MFDSDLRLSSATALRLPSGCSVDIPTSAPFRPPVFHVRLGSVANASKEHTTLHVFGGAPKWTPNELKLVKRG